MRDVKITVQANAHQGSAGTVIMRDNSQWSLNCGMWGGVRVYVHASLIACIVTIFYFATQFAQLHELDDVVAYGLIASAIYVASLVLHEVAHGLVASRMGGSVDLVILGPLGGMRMPTVPREPHREIICALAGPVLHFLVLMALGPALLVAGVNLGNLLLHPLHPSGVLSGPPLSIVAMKMAFWFNWCLLILNLAPAPALDGGYALRSILWPVMGYRAAVRTVSRSGTMISLMLCLLAVVLHEPANDHQLLPIWLPMAMLAIFFFFSSQQETQSLEEDDPEDDLFGYDFSQGFSSLEQTSQGTRHRQRGPMRRWLQQRQEMKERRLREIEAEEERRVDDVLIRVKEFGIEGLSPDERSLLHRVSARYRNRLQS
jgi:stage IV sporulation protein FB